MLAYGNLGLRESKDLDLFVDPEIVGERNRLDRECGLPAPLNRLPIFCPLK